jgi:hypothetical protein
VAFEDVALALALGRARLRPMAVSLSTSASRFKRRGWALGIVGRGLRIGLYLLGFPPKPPVSKMA